MVCLDGNLWVLTVKRQFFLLLVALLLPCSWGIAADDNEGNLQKQRKWFARAEAIAHNPNSSESKFLRQKLANYPLIPYVQLKTLMRYPFLSNKGNIEAFLTKYEKSPMDRPLRKKWLNYLADQNQQAMFLHFYRDIGDDSLKCHQLRFRLQRPEQRAEALKKVDALWLVGKSRPKSCDRVFAEWEKAGRRTDDMIYQRLKLAADGGKHTLIPYLKGLLPTDYHYLADLWLKVRRSPSYVSRTSRFPGINPSKESEVLAYGLKRLVWRDRDLALKSWEKLKTRFPFTEVQKQQIAEKFAIGLAIKNHPKAGQWLERANSGTKDEELYRWHLAHVLREQDWQQAVNVIESAPKDFSSDEQFRYWTARSLEQLSAKRSAKSSVNNSADNKAQNQFIDLSGERNYYGFMASGKLGKSPSLENQPVQFTQPELVTVSTNPAARRAYEFLKLKRFTSARREWNFLLSELNDEQKSIAGVLADSWGWHDQAIRTFAKAGYMNDVARRFPLAFKEQLHTSATENNISPAWAFAITRRESAFMSDAYSGAGARGLMQLMPGTARYLEKSSVKTRRLYDPEFNVQLGTRYLRYLMDRMDNNPILATAAYNAGWRRVKDWLPDQSGMPLDIWVETIPFKETRNYVKAVMAYKQIYSQQLGQQKNLFLEYSSMKIPESGTF